MGRRHDIEGQMSLFDLPVGNLQVKAETLMKKTSKEKTTMAEPPMEAGKFPECADCWCYTCEHSTVGGGVPRAFVDGEHPCPSCEFCISDGKADVCIIGSAKEGCGFRAAKEGIENGK